MARDFVEEYASLVGEYDDNSLHQYFSQKLLNISERIRPGRPKAVLELGCGSGLLATHFRDTPDKFIGIDISPHMLKRAAARGRYSALICGDIISEMEKLDEAFEAVLSGGVLCYLADLRPVFANVARLLSSGGIFAFSVDPSTDDMDIGVTNPGEYCHSRKYLRGLAADTRLEERLIEMDVHRGPPGFWCVFQKR